MSHDDLAEALAQLDDMLPSYSVIQPHINRFFMMDADAVFNCILGLLSELPSVAPYVNVYLSDLAVVISDMDDGEVRKDITIFLDTYYPEITEEIQLDYGKGDKRKDELLRGVLDKFIGVIRSAA